MNIPIKLTSNVICPSFATEGSAGFDLESIEDLFIKGINQIVKIHTGISLEIPRGYVGLLIERSSLHKSQLQLVNSVGVIDSDYRGEIILLLRTLEDNTFISKGQRLAQLVIMKLPNIKFLEVNELNETVRGKGGFGSTDL